MGTSASIIICTYNRAGSLIETLQSISQMDLGGGIDWEVLVVDNNSSDGTRKRVEGFIQEGRSNVRYLLEPKQGKANALNQGVKNALGEILAFTDDDALVDRHWLRLILDIFKEFSPDCVGGKIVPLWLGRRPEWLTDRFLNVLAVLDLGPEPRLLKSELVYGVNYAFRREVFERLGPYDSRLCGRGCGNEDHEMIDRLRGAGGRIFYDPRIIVHHKVFHERLTRAYFRRWYQLSGRDRAEMMSPGCRCILGIEGYMLRNFSRTLGQLISAGFGLNAEEFFHRELYCQLYMAYMRNRLMQFLSGRVPAVRETGKLVTVTDVEKEHLV